VTNRSYRIGRNFEYKVKKMFEDCGCLVWRLPKSKFPDLIIWVPDDKRLIGVECKVNKYLSKKEKKLANELIKKKIIFRVAYREGRRIKWWSGNIR